MNPNSTTISLTQSNSSTSLVFRASRASLEQYQSVMERLQDIIIGFQNWNDRLSLKLIKWSFKVSNITLGQRVRPEQLELIKKQIEKLVSKILVDPLGFSADRSPNAMLKEPMLDREWVWEKAVLDDYLEKTGVDLSPFDNQKIDPKPHEFAKAMLMWLRTFTNLENSAKVSTVSGSTNTLIIHTSNSNSSPSMVVSFRGRVSTTSHAQMGLSVPSQGSHRGGIQKFNYAFYLKLAQDAIRIERLKEEKRLLKKEVIISQHFRQELQENLRQRVEEAKIAIAEHEKVIDTRIGSMQSNYQGAINNLQSTVDAQARQTQYLQQQMSNSETRARQLEQQLHQANVKTQSLEREVEILRDEVDDLEDSSCSIM
ncbi:MAG: hypothetical protein K0S74_1134 [Chlamydiales bacterium]|jgi:hypothetical protein|nr:hypothetical protein [Chlamydiales bacterium]